MIYFLVALEPNSVEQNSSLEDSRSACQENPHILWNQRFINRFTRTCYWPLSWGSWIQSISAYPVYL